MVNLRSACLRNRFIAGLIGTGILSALAGQADATIYTLTGTCDANCTYVGLTDGDPISGAVEVTGSGALNASDFVAVDLSIGTGNALDSANPSGDGREIVAHTSGATFSDIDIRQPTGGGGYSDVFIMPDSGGADWYLSLSGSPLPQTGSGSWLAETTTSYYDFTGTCAVNCLYVGLGVGDAISATVSVTGIGSRSAIYYDFVDLSIGSFSLLDSLNPFGDGLTITSNVTATSITDFFIGLPASSGFSDVFFTPGTSVYAWELSSSSAPNAIKGDGSWSLRAGAGPGGGSGPTVVPEPGSLALLVFGLAGLGFVRRRKAA